MATGKAKGQVSSARMPRREAYGGAAAIVAVLALGCTGAAAQDYPAKPVRMVVSFAAGGPTDIVGRVMSAKMSELSGPAVRGREPDRRRRQHRRSRRRKVAGRRLHLLVATVSTHAINPGLYKKIPYDPIDGFRADRPGRRDADPPGRASLDPGDRREEPRRVWPRATRANTPTVPRASARSFICAASSSRRGQAGSTSRTCPIAALRS